MTYRLRGRTVSTMVRYLVRCHVDNPKSRLLLAVFPVVLYSGSERPWRGPPRVEELFALPGQGMVTEFIIQLQASPEGAKHLAMLLDYLSRLKDQRAYENARLVVHSVAVVPPTEDFMKSYAEELEERGRQNGLIELGTELLAQLPASSEGAKRLTMLLDSLSRLEDERAYENARRVLHSVSRAPPTEKGEKRGRQSTLARAVLQVLAARSVYVDDQTRQRVLSCKSLKILNRWLTQAALATSLSDVFGEPQQ